MLVPVVLVSGFLGAGKTTFLRSLLNNTQGVKIAVVRNEFADIADLSLEVPLLVPEDLDGLTVLEFPNSCVCCSAKTAFVEAVHKLVADSKGKSRTFDLVVVEVSGLTDPLVIGDEFITSMDPVNDFVELKKVISIIDSTMKLEALSSDPLFQRFIVAADLIFLNKKDRSSLSQIEELQSAVSLMNPGVECIRTDHCSEFTATDLLKLAREPVRLACVRAETRANIELCSKVHLVDRIIIHEQIVIKSEELESLETAIGVWLWSGEPGSIWRGKGLLALDDKSWAELQICADSIALKRIVWTDAQGRPPSPPLLTVNLSDPWTRILIIGTRSRLDDIRDVLLAHT